MLGFKINTHTLQMLYCCQYDISKDDIFFVTSCIDTSSSDACSPVSSVRGNVLQIVSFKCPYSKT